MFSLPQAVLRAFTEPTFSELGVTVGRRDSVEQRHARHHVAPLACEAGLPACIAQAGALFQAWLRHPADTK